MKKILFLFCCSGLILSAQAGVRSLGDNSGYSTNKKSSTAATLPEPVSSQPVVNLKNVNTAERCMDSGFTMRSCPSGYVAVYPCPENNKYFRDCCPQEYRFTESQCREYGLEPSKETCLTFHACREKQVPSQETEQGNLKPDNKNKEKKEKNKFKPLKGGQI